ncbi:restriction endonuclease subunit S [bacterium]|nr:MAG: restriction endonuclease subunit S [bacterium]
MALNMNEWKEFKIGQLLILEYGKSLTDYRSGKGKYNVFGTNGKIGLSDFFLYDEPALIIGRKGAYREVHLANEPFFVIDTAFYTKKKNELANTSFMYYWFKNVDINAMDSGSAIPSTNRDEVYDLDIKLPPLQEQKTIASVLSSLDDKIDLLHRQNATLEKMAETLFRQWFVEEAKEDWEVTTLYDAIELVGGGTPKTSVEEYWNGNIKWLSGGDIVSNHKSIITSSEKTITEEGLNNSSAKLLPKFSTVISARGTVGKYCILSEPMAYSQSNYGIKPKYQDCYFFTYLLINHLVEELNSAAYGSVFDTITTNTFKGLEITIPPENEIRAIESNVESYFIKILNNQNQIHTLTTMRDTLLPKLMSGEVRIKGKL